MNLTACSTVEFRRTVRVAVTYVTTQTTLFGGRFSESDRLDDVLVYFIVGVFLHFDRLEVARQGVGFVGVCHTDTGSIVNGE